MPSRFGCHFSGRRPTSICVSDYLIRDAAGWLTMSGKAVIAALNAEVKKPSAKFVLVAIASAYNEHTHICAPSRKRLANETGYDLSTIKRAIKALSQAGLIRTIPRSDYSGRQRSNQYELQFHECTAPPSNVLEWGQHSPPKGRRLQPPLKEQKDKQKISSLLSNGGSKSGLTSDAEFEARFEELFSTFPKRPGGNKSHARNAFKLLSIHEQTLCLDYAKRYLHDFNSSRKKHKTSHSEQLKYVPFLHNWLSNGQWHAAETLPKLSSTDAENVIKMKNSTILDRSRNERLFKMCEMVRAKSVPISMDKFGFPNEIVAEAKRRLLVKT